eukprot:Hpha_TRINITY_DN30002_c0_g1::TRINITY_DN30002_c0_g1_i1::g.21549::m.21549/K02440/GLPF; glycerol uptake facilitator protein
MSAPSEEVPLRPPPDATAPPRRGQELVAEALGTGLLVLVGTSSVAASQAKAEGRADGIDPDAAGVFINAAWGIGVTMGVLAAFDASGAHLNPSVTLSTWMQGGVTTRQAARYVVAQCAGAFVGALLTTLDYVVFRGESHLRNFYCTEPLDGRGAASWANAFMNEVIATAVLILGVCAVTAPTKSPPNKFHVAGFMGAVVFAIGNAFGSITGYALNPARDAAPRLCYMVFHLGYNKAELWKQVLGEGYFWVPIIAPLVGAALATVLWRATMARSPPQPPESAVCTMCAVRVVS